MMGGPLVTEIKAGDEANFEVYTKGILKQANLESKLDLSQAESSPIVIPPFEDYIQLGEMCTLSEGH